MIYLDYSATTPINKEVLDTYCRVSLEFIGNPNSLHKLGIETSSLIAASTKQISDILGISYNEVIYTSGASESNNMAIKGIALKYANRGKHIITTKFEHSSVYGPISYLQSLGYDVDFIDTNEYGVIEIESLKKLLREDTLLVTIASVNSETGLKQPVEELAKVLKEYPKCFFHVDATQSIGKEDINLTEIDLVSFTAHKFYGPKGIGVLVKKEKIDIIPLIHGGKSTTSYRSGTPVAPLIASLAKSLRLANVDIDKKYKHVKELSDYLKEKLETFEKVHINSNDYCLPHMLNFSVIDVKPETMQHALEEYDIYISTQTACSNGAVSTAVKALTNNDSYAISSLRLSLSHLSTKEECDMFLKAFEECYNKLTNLR